MEYYTHMTDGEGFTGDPYHEGPPRPQEHLQGGMEMPHTQMPMMSESKDDPRTAAVDNIGQSWESTSLRPGHTTLNPTNDKRKAH